MFRILCWEADLPEWERIYPSTSNTDTLSYLFSYSLVMCIDTQKITTECLTKEGFR